MPVNEFIGPEVEWFALAPLLVLVLGALGLLLIGALTPRWPRGLSAFVASSVAGAAGVLAIINWVSIADDGPRTLMAGAMAFDALAQFITVVIIASLILVILVSDDEVRASGVDEPEVYALYLLAAAGGVVMGAANDLIVLFIGLESLSLALYVLAASARRRRGSQESGLKYFILGGFASAVFLYGIALIYGGTGSTNFGQIIGRLQGSVTTGSSDALALAGIALLLVGLGFKIGSVPFHQWVPDVYQGAPSPVTALMGSVGKAAAFGALLRVLVIGLPLFRDDWRPVIWVLALLSLLVGPLLAAVQSDVKRMIAYSSVAHVGFMLIGVEAAGHRAGEADLGSGMPSVVLYLLFYGIITVGTLGVVTVVARGAAGDTSLRGLVGLSARRPALALGLTVLLLAQAGVPFTTGFVAKFGVIRAAVEAQSYLLAVLAMVAAIVAAFVYLRIMITVWARSDAEVLAVIGAGVESGGDESAPPAAVPSVEAVAESGGRLAVPTAAAVAIGAAALFTVVFGIEPVWFIDLAQNVNDYAR
jgi:NADH-quinone oxidoreductase subunit N